MACGSKLYPSHSRTSYDVPSKEVYQEEEPQLNGVVHLNMDQSSLTRGNAPLELVVDASTIGGKIHVMDEGFIDDDEIDPTDSEFSQKEDSWEDSTDSN